MQTQVIVNKQIVVGTLGKSVMRARSDRIIAAMTRKILKTVLN